MWSNLPETHSHLGMHYTGRYEGNFLRNDAIKDSQGIFTIAHVFRLKHSNQNRPDISSGLEMVCYTVVHMQVINNGRKNLQEIHYTIYYVSHSLLPTR